MEGDRKLWGRATSYNVQKVAWVLVELDLAHDRIDAGGVFGGLDDAVYVAMNPNKRVPTLIDGDLVLWESNAICRYLVDQYGSGSPLKPATAAERAQADMWMEWFQNTLYVQSIALFYQTVRLPPSQRDPAERDRALATLNDALRIFDDRLADRTFITGAHLSLGDVATGTFLYRYYTMQIERPALKHLARYYDALIARPAYRAAVMIDYSALRGVD